jgi:hypothetical protein
MTLKKFFPPRKNKHKVGAIVWYYTGDETTVVATARILKLGKKFCICKEIGTEKKFRRAFYNLFYTLKCSGQQLVRLDK